MWYIVKPWDSLYTIAIKCGVSISQLLQFNPAAYYTLYVGQRLFIPTRYLRALVNYTVTTGDTLDSIAQNFNTTKQSIIQLNNLTSENIQPGQKLSIETDSRTALRASRPTTNYVVQVGDTLDSVAQKFNVTKQSIMQLNNLSSDFIVPEQELKIETRSNIPRTKFRPTATYTVKVGDSLETIARKFNTTKEALMKLNGLVSEELKAGDTLNVEFSRERFPETNVTPQDNLNIINSPKDIYSKYKFFSIYDSSLRADIKIWKEVSTQDTYFFISKMVVTADGAPQAFHRENQLAYDFLDNAGTIGYWWRLVTDDQGFPLIQGINDPAPGYFISKTALSDCSKPLNDPSRYVDASVIPYIALPTQYMMDAKLGDLCVVINTLNNKIGYAIIADVGSNDSIGIGSVALAKDIGIVSSPKMGGVEDGILYIVFGQSGAGWCKLKTREQIINEAQWLFKQWGGIEKVYALFNNFPLSYTNIQ